MSEKSFTVFNNKNNSSDSEYISPLNKNSRYISYPNPNKEDFDGFENMLRPFIMCDNEFFVETIQIFFTEKNDMMCYFVFEISTDIKHCRPCTENVLVLFEIKPKNKLNLNAVIFHTHDYYDRDDVIDDGGVYGVDADGNLELKKLFSYFDTDMSITSKSIVNFINKSDDFKELLKKHIQKWVLDGYQAYMEKRIKENMAMDQLYDTVKELF